MAKEWAKGFYNSSRWIKCRQSFINQRIMIDGGMCQECHSVPGEIVHHKIILTDENINDERISLSFDNLEFVCHKCHDEFEGHGIHGNGKIKPLCMFTADGQPVSLRDIDRKVPPDPASPLGSPQILGSLKTGREPRFNAQEDA